MRHRLRTLLDWLLGRPKPDNSKPTEQSATEIGLVLAELDRARLPQVFKQIWTQTLPPSTRFLWPRPHTYFAVRGALERRVPQLKGLLPLWEQNGEAIYGLLPDGSYVRFYYEDVGAEDDPNAYVEVLGQNYQQFVTSVLIDLSEAGLTDEFEEAAQLLEYRYTRELRAILDAYTEETGEQELQRFRASCV